MSAAAIERFACFGGVCELRVEGPTAAALAAAARGRLLDWHRRFTRFTTTSELARLNADEREQVPASATMTALATAVAGAARRTGGLVDGTLVRELEAAGYTEAARGVPLPLALALRLAAKRAPATPHRDAGWRRIETGPGTVRRPPGLAIDSGGLAKGLFADLLAAELWDSRAFVVDCCGDMRLGGATARPVRVASPFGSEILHTFELAGGGVATSGIGKRSWLGANGRPAHHLLDPATGRPAFTGVVQATALAPTALEAETLAKAAVLSGPAGAPAWLPHGGVVVFDDRSHRVIDPQ